MSTSNTASVHVHGAGPDSMPVNTTATTSLNRIRLARYRSKSRTHGRPWNAAWVACRDKLAWFAGLYALSVLSFGALVGGVRWTLSAI